MKQRNRGIYRYRVPACHVRIMRRLRAAAKRIAPEMLVFLI
jgi:hypothetical protein